VLARVLCHNIRTVSVEFAAVVASGLGRGGSQGHCVILLLHETRVLDTDHTLGTSIFAKIFDRAADSINVDGFTSFNLEAALLHDAGGVVPDTVAQVARARRIVRNLHAVHVELIVNHTAAGVGGHGQGGDGGGDVVVAGSADQRRGQDRARP